MKKEQIIDTMRKWYFPNFFDLEMFDYTTLNDEEVFNIYLQEKDTYGEEIDEMLEKHTQEENEEIDFNDTRTREELIEIAENLDGEKIRRLNQEREEKIEEYRKLWEEQ